MDLFQNVLRGTAAIQLQEKALRCAYVFGAASPLGEALLNQVLADPTYRQVYVMTDAPLPASIPHLRGLDATQAFKLQDNANAVDFLITVQSEADTKAPSASARRKIYTPLVLSQLATFLQQADAGIIVASASGLISTKANVRCLLVAQDLDVSILNEHLSSYASHWQCAAYGLAPGTRASSSPYTFQAQGNSVLDRLGVSLLNTLVRIAAQIISPNAATPLTTVKTAQRLMQRFQALHQLEISAKSVTTITASNLA